MTGTGRKNVPGDNWPSAAQKNLGHSFGRNIDGISMKSLFTSDGRQSTLGYSRSRNSIYEIFFLSLYHLN